MSKKSVLVLGVGGTGVATVQFLEKRLEKTAYRERVDAEIVTAVLDTGFPSDASLDATAISLRVGMPWERVRDYLGREVWGDAQAYDPMPFEGAVFTRHEAYMAFLLAMQRDEKREALDCVLSQLSPDESGGLRVFFAASLAGSIGSGVVLPLALYVKGRLRAIFPSARVETCAFLTLPEVHDPRGSMEETDRPVFYANAYAFFRELSALECAATAGKISGLCIGHKDTAVGVLFDAVDTRFHTPDARPFDRVCLKGRTSSTATIASHYEAMANEIYMLACTGVGRVFFSSPVSAPAWTDILKGYKKDPPDGEAFF